MIKELIKISNKLDLIGLTKEADELDGIIRKMSQMETDWWRAITRDDVNAVLSALAKAPPSDWEGPTWNSKGLTALAKEAEPYGLLKAIKGWIQGVSEEKRTPGMKEALVLINGIADRVGFSIDGAPAAAGPRVEAFLNDAWYDEDEEEVGRVVTRDDVALVLDILTHAGRQLKSGWNIDGVEKLYNGLTRLHMLDLGVGDDDSVAGDSGVWVLAGIKGWIEHPTWGDETLSVRRARFKPALDAIERIAERKKITITGSDFDEAVGVYGLLDDAYTA